MLEGIVASTRRRIHALWLREDEVRSAAAARTDPRDFAGPLRAPGLQVIAEFKRRSPSGGVLAAGITPALQARRYLGGGAAAISVLTEPDLFDGSSADLEAVRAISELPILCKDFTLDPLQVWEAKAMGADALLLVVALLDQPSLTGLLHEAKQARLAALVEVHDEDEARRAVDTGANLVGVNSRDLSTFEVDPTVAERIAGVLPGVTKVAESGIRSGADAARMAAAGYDAVLVGESLMRSPDPAALISELRGAGR